MTISMSAIPPVSTTSNNEGFAVTNLRDGETVHQRCLLLTGRCGNATSDGYISVKTKTPNGSEDFPEQTWPTAGNSFKALVMLSPGHNNLEITYMADGSVRHSFMTSVNYIPLLQNPPLHLAIMIGKDSPCIIDCPPHKAGGLSSAHSDLNAAVAKFRMTAYMWQALTAEDLMKKGLGRRTFRLDEQWDVDTTSQSFLNARYDNVLDQEGAMRSTAKVHVIRSSKTVEELRNPNIAQQNQSARQPDALFDYFMEALREAGGPFTSSAQPIVAGMILDSHYNISKKLILGHAALGCHNPNGISLGMMGSHLTYAWPRFLEEVTACLTDIRSPGDTVGNDNGECGSMWEACSIGQGAALHEVGHAFGSPHRPGIMERGYAQDWPKTFLTKTAYCSAKRTEGVVVNEETPSKSCWHDADALSFQLLRQFRLPQDQVLSPEDRIAKPQVTMEADTEGLEGKPLGTSLLITAPIGITRVTFNQEKENLPSIQMPFTQSRYLESELLKRFNRAEPLRLQVLGYNGKETVVTNVWRLFNTPTHIQIPGTSLRLSKRSIAAEIGNDEDKCNGEPYEWAQLLREKGPDGKIYRATSIDLRVGCIMDGGVVKYADGHTSHWGPMRVGGNKHEFGGHASEKINLPKGVEISRIELNPAGWDCMAGIRMHLTNGTSRGELNAGDNADLKVLEPRADEVIVGFFGQSQYGSFNGVLEFGILTAPKNVGLDGLPKEAFGFSELRNTAGMDEDGDDCQFGNDGSQNDEDEDEDMDSDGED